ncbi:Uncharacterised protein [uncultured Eubacterium sp.]|nr:Uncharacterised protein [uncultured Eubacterium sp.]
MDERKSSIRIICAGGREIQLKCPICGCEEFYDRKTLLNTAGMTYLGLDWANDEATNYVCRDCSYIFWFENAREKLEKPRDPLKELEADYTALSEKRLRKIIDSDNYNDTAKKAARNVLSKRRHEI